MTWYVVLGISRDGHAVENGWTVSREPDIPGWDVLDEPRPGLTFDDAKFLANAANEKMIRLSEGYEARLILLEAALRRLSSMEAFIVSRAITCGDEELVARIRYAETILTEISATNENESTQRRIAKLTNEKRNPLNDNWPRTGAGFVINQINIINGMPYDDDSG